jgi:predicted GNAT superfamily acetyltransferase
MIDGLDYSSSWGTFLPQKSILTETQPVQRSVPPPPVDTNDTDLFEDLFIYPANNFAFRAIAKNAVSQWKTVLRNVMENRMSRGFSGPDYSLDESSLARHGVEQAKKILES